MFPIIPVTSTVQIPTYYLIISLTVVVSLFWVTYRARKYQMSHQLTLDLSLIIMVSGFIGGRLMHVFYENFEYYRADYRRILQFWDGGFVFYGGALFAALMAILFLQWKAAGKQEKYLDLMAPVISFSYAFGRLGCLFAGCCYGRFCELPWAVGGRHPTQVYASLWELGVLFILLGLESIAPAHRRPHLFGRSGSIFYLWMILHGLGRLLMETFRDDFRGPSLGLSISSWISILVVLLGIYLLVRRRPADRSSALTS